MSSVRFSRWALWALGVAIALSLPLIYWTTTSGLSALPAGTDTTVRAAENLFVGDPAIQIEQPSEHPIGRVGGALILRDRLLLSDMLTGEVRAYSLQGELIRVIGVPGDGPGEFRVPMHLFAMQSGGFGVYDLQHDAISVFDSAGSFVRRMNLKVTRVGMAPVSLPGLGILVPARGDREFEAAPASPVPRVHLISDSGAVLRSVGALPAPRNGEEELMAQMLLARVGGHLVYMQSTDPSVYITAIDGSTTRTASAATQFYRPPTWPVGGFSGRDAMTKFQKWHGEQMAATGLISLDEHRFAVAFTLPGSKGTPPTQHLVVMDVNGRRHFVTPPGKRIHRTLGDRRVGTVQQSDDGDVTLQMLRVALPVAVYDRPSGSNQ